MSDWPHAAPAPAMPPTFTTIGRQGLSYGYGAATNSLGASAVWTLALRCIYQGFLVTAPITVQQLSLTVATASGNLNAAIYDSDSNGLPRALQGTALGSTVVPAAGTAVLNIVDVALNPGLYHVALAVDNITASFSKLNPPNALTQIYGLQMETLGAIATMPATATPVNLTTNYQPIVGVHCVPTAA